MCDLRACKWDLEESLPDPEQASICGPVKVKATMRETIKYIDACSILHNLLVGIRDDVPDELLHEIERLSDIDECEPLEDDDELNQPVLENRQANTQRNQLMHYFNEKTAVFY